MAYRLDLKPKLVPLLPRARKVELLRAVGALDHSTLDFAAQTTSLKAATHQKSYRRRSRVIHCLTVVHLCRVMVLKPSTSLSRDASVKVSSGVNTAQSICVHPWPSVGFIARSRVSEGGHGFILRSTGPALGQSKQSWFCGDDIISLIH